MSSHPASSSTPPTPTQPNPPCTNPTCPSTHPHNAGAYNFTLCANEATRTNHFPKDLRGVLHRLTHTSTNRSEDYEFLARFAVAHQSHRGGFLPSDITRRIYWTNNVRILEILRAGRGSGVVRPGTIAPVVKMVKAGGEREGRVVGVAKAVGKREGQKLVVVQKGGRFAALAGKVEGKEEEEEE